MTSSQALPAQFAGAEVVRRRREQRMREPPRARGPDDPAPLSVVFTSQFVPVSGDGSYVSPPFIPTQAGTYYWATSI